MLVLLCNSVKMVLSMERWIGKVAIVTGASSGIGAAISECLVKEGLKVVGLARRVDRLEIIARELCNFKGEFFPLSADISKDEDILKAFDWIKKNLGPVSILINNAGVNHANRIIDSTPDMWRDILHVNVVGLCFATTEAVKNMRENNNSGHIVNINSVLGHYFYNVPHANIYPASKHAVTALTGALRLELGSLETTIKITSISPGLVDTEILGDFRNSDQYRNLKEKGAILKTEDVAESVIYVLSTPPSVQVEELIIRATGDIMGR